MEKIIKSKTCNILWLAYKQSQVFEKFKVDDNFIDTVKKIGIIKISIVKFVNKYRK